jgi:hypothetical protein
MGITITITIIMTTITIIMTMITTELRCSGLRPVWARALRVS